MGNSVAKADPQALEDGQLYSKPTGLYAMCAWRDDQVKKLVTSRKIAPRYCGVDSSDSIEIWRLEECPICFLWYPSLNRCVCCEKSICTECYLQIQLPRRVCDCPFCKKRPFKVKYRGKITEDEKQAQLEEEQRVQTLKMEKMKDDEANPRLADQSGLGSSIGVNPSELGLKEDATVADILSHAMSPDTRIVAPVEPPHEFYERRLPRNHGLMNLVQAGESSRPFPYGDYAGRLRRAREEEARQMQGIPGHGDRHRNQADRSHIEYAYPSIWGTVGDGLGGAPPWALPPREIPVRNRNRQSDGLIRNSGTGTQTGTTGSVMSLLSRYQDRWQEYEDMMIEEAIRRSVEDEQANHSDETAAAQPVRSVETAVRSETTTTGSNHRQRHRRRMREMLDQFDVTGSGASVSGSVNMGDEDGSVDADESVNIDDELPDNSPRISALNDVSHMTMMGDMPQNLVNVFEDEDEEAMMAAAMALSLERDEI